MSKRKIKKLVLDQLRDTKIPKSRRRNVCSTEEGRGMALGRFACKKHIDKNNVGPSYSIALGDFEGGELEVDDGEYIYTYESQNRFVKFNGRNEHWVLPFEGERYSLVYFTHTFNGLNPIIYT
jgi:hypothetical protein